MRILSRYILKEIIEYAGIGLLVFSFIIYVRPLSQLLELVARRNLSGSETLTLFLLPLPTILVLTIPIAVLVGTLIGLSRMTADGETVALRACGQGAGQIVRPVLLFSLAAWIVASCITLFIAPWAARRLASMEARLGATEAAYEIQPRVFIERFPHLLLYIEDIRGTRPTWRRVFIADTQHAGSIRVTLAKSGRLVNGGPSRPLTLDLEQGETQEYNPSHPKAYTIVTFAQSDIPIAPLATPTSPPKSPALLTPFQLWTELHQPSQRQPALVELNYRLALPFATLVLPLVGIPLGIMTRKGGKAYGIIVSIFLVLIYYVLMAGGLSFAKQGKVDPRISLWLANVLFGICGLLLVSNMNRAGRRLHKVKVILEELLSWVARQSPFRATKRRAQRVPRTLRTEWRFPQILDVYVIRGWAFYLFALLLAFSGIYMIFDFFQLLGDIVRHHDHVSLILNYYRYLAPEVVYRMLPLSILAATLVALGILTKWNETTAVRSVGTSLYRVSAPILALCLLCSAGMFLMENDFLPYTNQRQDALRNLIKGKPPQTTYGPGRQWIFGEGQRIYYYRYFNSERDVFAHLSVFEFTRHNFQLKRRIYAERAFWERYSQNWVLEDGWVRDISGDRVTLYRSFTLATFKELKERPSYFKTEVKPSEQMGARELARYIRELRQSGFNVVQLSVEFYRKFSYPLIALVVALIGIPFAYSIGRRGALSGVAMSIAIAMVYWSVSSLFVAMGNLNQLPPAIAAWSPDVIFALGGTYLFLRIRT